MITNNLIFTVFLCILIPFSSQLAESDEDSEGLGIPNDAVGRPKLPLRLNPSQPRRADIPSNRCYCTYNDGICDGNKTCIKDEMAACFHAVEEVYNKADKRMETWHKYGCAPLEKGSNASHLTCNSWRSAHFHPKSIACCYEGDYCNMHIEPPPYVNANELEDDWSEESPLRQNLTFYVVMIFVVFVLVVGLVTLFFYQKRRRTTLKKCQSMSDVEKEPMLYEDSGSGSGSGKTTMNQRTVAQSLTIIKVIGRGRYGEVRKALYRGSYVAVKTFYTTDEESWKNERDVYQTHMLNHENILQYVAADICSEDSITQMLLITDYHQLGSLCDYLRREETLTIEEALQLCHSSVCGLEHLHAAVHGTGSRRKPEMAHRDIKSKNIIVKRPGVCCIADFGLAVRYEGGLLPEKVNVQVGTKRYMAPEVLSKTLNPASFSQFKMADMYSFALVMWEVARRVEWQPLAEAESEPVVPESSNSDSSGYCGSSEETSGRIMHRQSTSCEMASQRSTRAMPYTPPFEGLVEGDPSFDEMKKIVCEKGNRPPIAHSWSNGSNLSLFVLSCVMRDCWHPAPQCRHSALKVKMELAKAIERLRETHNKTRSQKLSTSSNTGSLTKTNTIDSGFRDVIIRSDEENNISSHF